MPETDPLLGHPNGRNGGVSSHSTSMWSRMKGQLAESVDASKAGPALAMQCFIVGAADAAVFNQTATWAAFMTGNLTQLSISAINLVFTHPSPVQSVQRLRSSASAVLGFILGCFFFSLLDRIVRPPNRGKLVVTALIRSVIFAIVAAFVAEYGWDEYSGMILLFVLAMCMGSMAVNANRIGSTPYATTVVVTASLSNVFSDPLLPLSLSDSSKTRGISILCLIGGAAAAQTVGLAVTRFDDSHLLDSKSVGQLGSAISILMVAIADLVTAVIWFRVGKTEQ